MFCKHCGNKIDDDSNFCKYCGKDVLLEKNHYLNLRKAVKQTIDSITKYDWSESIEFATKRYPNADNIKFRVCFKTNTFNLNRDYNNFLCLDSEKDVKAAIIKYLTDLLEGLEQTTEDYDLDIYVSTDAFFSKDHDENEYLFDESDIINGNIYDDNDGNHWISISCLFWMLGYAVPLTSFWKYILDYNPANGIKIESCDLFNRFQNQ